MTFTLEYLLTKHEVSPLKHLAIEAAARRLPHKRSGRLVFLEERDFLRILKGTEGMTKRKRKGYDRKNQGIPAVL